MTPAVELPGPIVVGVERSDRSRDALALARTLARALGSRLILVTVYPLDAWSASMERGAYAHALAEDAESALDWMAAPLAGPRPDSRAVPCASIPSGLHEVARAERALAIVVGPSHGGALGRIVPGSVGERLVRGAPCPVAVAPRGYRTDAPARLARIGVGYGAAPEADEALRAAVGLAARTRATIRVLNVVEPPIAGASLPFDELQETAREALTSRIRSATDDASATVEISGEVIDGYADDELARLSLEVDLLVCGSSGHRPVASVLTGSMSAGILRKARCPVLMVPRGARDGFAALRPPAAASAA